MNKADEQTGRGRSGVTLTSPWVLAAVVMPPALWLLIAVGGAGLPLAEACSARTFQGYVLLCAVLLGYRTVKSLLARAHIDALVSLALLLLLLQGGLWYGYRFEGEAGAGTGDQIVDYQRQEAGPLSGDTRIPARVEAIPEKGGGKLEFSLDAERVQVPMQGSFRWRNFRITPLKIERAPLVTVRTAGGDEVESLYFKMGTVAPERDFFLVKTLPHRIYVAPDGDKGIKIRIMRDKIRVADTTVVWGEQFPYNDHVISFAPGALWVRLGVERIIPRWPSIAAAVAVALAGLAAFRQRKKSRVC